MKNREIWKNIKGFENLYQVSNMGRVRSLKFGKKKIMKLTPNKQGYLRVKLYKNGETKDFRVSRLVAFAFVENPNPQFLKQVNHINEIKTDNRASNLEWCNCQYNIRYSKAKKVVGIGKNEIVLLQAASDGRFWNLDRNNLSKAAKGVNHWEGNHTYKGKEWYYITPNTYKILYKILGDDGIIKIKKQYRI